MTFKQWSFSYGDPPYRVTAYERTQKKGTLYLRWRKNGNWKHRSLAKKLRSASGNVIKSVATWAKAQAQVKHYELVKDIEAGPETGSKLTISGTWQIITDHDTGMYLRDTPHRREVDRALKFAERVWGASAKWDSVGKRELKMLWRRRIRELQNRGHRALRAAEIGVSRLLAIAAALRDDQLIAPDSCLPPRNWKKLLQEDWKAITEQEHDYEPQRPRFSVDESRAIFAAAPHIDPRFDLMLALGAELRLGQVRRAWRSDLDLEAGTFTVRSHGHKRGEDIYLTEDQLHATTKALNGYLAELEQTGADYRLFPAGQLLGGRKGVPKAEERHRNAKPIGRRRVLEWVHKAEEIAGIDHQPGRSAYGIRRIAVDFGKDDGISREGLMKLGGWTDTQMPDRVYADRESTKARKEAAETRARFRGEGALEAVTSDKGVTLA